MTKILIDVPEGEDELDTIRHVADMIEEGYTSGVNPTWDILKDGVEVEVKNEMHTCSVCGEKYHKDHPHSECYKKK